ncbi:MAG: 4Fe-4S dicluster domain-containing protein [Verrucomicrobia bacterium]|nr:4Fe-4S dicluster domain-containing protein [Verrucomicrobiota bacterium]
MSTTSSKPQRWDDATSFGGGLSDAEVDRLMTLSPFREMDQETFPKRLPLRGILQNDTRIRKFSKGEMVVRQGDYGTSAFLIMSGEVKVVLKPELPPRILGRKEAERPNIFRIFSQFWNSKHPETRKPFELKAGDEVSARQADDGELKVFLQDIPRILDQHQTATIGSGEFFGEISALGRIPRTATTFCEKEAELLEIRWQGLRDLLKYDKNLKMRIDQIYRERALASHLLKMPMFRNLTPENLQKVIDEAEFRTYGEYDWSGDYKKLVKAGAAEGAPKEPVIVQEGDYLNGLVLIRAGFARLSQKFGRGLRTLNYLGVGQSYGFDEIAHNWRKKEESLPFQYTLTAIGYTHVIVIPTNLIEELVLPTLPPKAWPALIQKKEEAAPTVEKNKAAETRIGPDMMEFVAEHRFFNGTATMLIDLTLCTRCDDCVRACASTHNNNPRFLRNGPTNGNVMVANACMHCVDPVCMIGCPTGAIHRNAFEGEVVINQSTCIGCQSCASNCPYDAIRMVEARDTKGRLVLDKEMKGILKATKCDLCVDQYGGPACERACPHDALVRLNMNDLDSFAKWLK